jgi:hypothetical protein
VDFAKKLLVEGKILRAEVFKAVVQPECVFDTKLPDEACVAAGI